MRDKREVNAPALLQAARGLLGILPEELRQRPEARALARACDDAQAWAGGSSAELVEIAKRLRERTGAQLVVALEELRLAILDAERAAILDEPNDS